MGLFFLPHPATHYIPKHLKPPMKVVFVLMREMDGKTLNRLKSYLSRFWEYYQTSPTFQKALADAG